MEIRLKAMDNDIKEKPDFTIGNEGCREFELTGLSNITIEVYDPERCETGFFDISFDIFWDNKKPKKRQKQLKKEISKILNMNKKEIYWSDEFTP